MKKSAIIRNSFVSLLFTYAVVELAAKITSIINGLMVGQLLGETELAAFGLTSPYNTFLEIASAVLITGAQALTVRNMVAGESEITNKVYSVTVEIATVASFIVGLLCFVFSTSICKFLGATGNNILLFDPLNSYNLGFSLGIPFLIIFAVLSVFVTLDGNKLCVTIASVSLAVINILLNYVFANYLNLGMFGFGLASTIARVVSVLILLTDLIRKNCIFSFHITLMPFKEVIGMIGVGLTKLTRKGSTMIKKFCLNKIILMAGGVASMTAMSARGNVDDFLMCLGVGVSGALMLMTQVFYGKEDSSSIRKAFLNAVLWILCGTGGLCLLSFIFAPNLANLFDIQSEAFDTTVLAIRCLSLGIPLTSINEMLFDYLQAMRKFKWAHVYIFFQRLTIVPVAFILVKLFGENGFWWAYLFGEVPVTLGYCIVIPLLQRKEKTSIIDSLLLIPKRFIDAENNSLEISLDSDMSPVGTSKKVYDFCKEKGVDNRKTYLASLCTEEMLCNIKEHGFNKDTKTHHCEFRIVADDDLTLYFNDDCEHFDLKKRYESIKDGDIEKNIGIKILCRSCSEVIYNSSLGSNNVTLRVK